jgi:hypothetical protein
MRDIRQDLQERLDAIAADRGSLHTQLELLDKKEASVKAMLADEESRIRRNASVHMELPFDRVPLVGGMQMTELIKATLRSGSRRLTFDEVKEEITKTPFDFGEQKPGRVVHGGLLSLLRTNEITKDADGRYGLLVNNGAKILPRERTQ